MDGIGEDLWFAVDSNANDILETRNLPVHTPYTTMPHIHGRPTAVCHARPAIPGVPALLEADLSLPTLSRRADSYRSNGESNRQ